MYTKLNKNVISILIPVYELIKVNSEVKTYGI